MYLHLGEDTVVNDKDIIGIFDIENTSTGKNTKAFLSKAGNDGRVINVSYEMPKSFIVCSRGKKSTVYISQVSAATLRRRAQTNHL